MNKQEQIQKAVDAAIASVPFQWRKRDTKTTKKALKQIEELGLTEYLPVNMRDHGGKYASSVAAVIKAATFAGSSKIASSMGEDGSSWVETEEAHELYNLLNAPEEEPVKVNAFGRKFTPSQETLDYIARGYHLSTKNYREEIAAGAMDDLLITRVTVGFNVDSNQD